MTDKPDAKTVLERPSQIRCTCGHVAYEHGACCFHCDCEATIDKVMKAGYRDALERSEAQYQDLLYQVETKHEGETRHETAKRYIAEAEKRDKGDGVAALAAGEAKP